jgi:hypothetical protein
MLKHVSRARWDGAWCAAVVVIGTCGVVAGAAMTISNSAWVLVAGLVPLAVARLACCRWVVSTEGSSAVATITSPSSASRLAPAGCARTP